MCLKSVFTLPMRRFDDRISTGNRDRRVGFGLTNELLETWNVNPVQDAPRRHPAFGGNKITTK